METQDAAGACFAKTLRRRQKSLVVAGASPAAN